MTMRNWQIVKFVAVVGTAVVALQGATTRKWRRWHTAFVVMGAVATIGAAVTQQRQRSNQGAMAGSSRGTAPSAVA